MTERFARCELVPGWSQESLRRAKVIVAGVGALGNYVTQTLALAGVGHLVLCDPDHVSESNLSRAPLFKERHIGVAKAEAAVETLSELAPGVVAEPRVNSFERAIGLAELRDSDLVLSLPDSGASRVQIAGRCGLVRQRVVDAGTSHWGGEVRCFLDPEGPCYGCMAGDEGRAASAERRSCDQENRAEGASAATSGLIAAFASMTAIRTLLGLAPRPAHVLVIDGATGATRSVAVPRDSNCALHAPVEAAYRLALGRQATVGGLMKHLAPGLSPLLWHSVEARAVCPGCGHVEADTWRAQAQWRQCPRCNRLMRPETVRELAEVPPSMRLSDIGLPSGEIVKLRTANDTLEFAEVTYG
jgi:molybdopterin/thiamine biosynthesis adenylyltransferase